MGLAVDRVDSEARREVCRRVGGGTIGRIDAETDRPRPPSPLRRWLLIGTVAYVAALSIIGLLGRGRTFVEVQPGGALFDDRVLPVFFVAFLVSAAISWRWPLTGGVVGLLAVATFVPFAQRQLVPWSAAFLIGTMSLAVAAWLAIGLTERGRDVSDRPDADELAPTTAMTLDRRRFLSTVAGGAVAVVAGSIIGRYVYGLIWGPTHPESEVAELPDSPLDWAWCGAVTTSGCAIRARSSRPFTTATLQLARDADFTDIVDTVALTDVYDRVADFRVDGLDAATRYFYAVEVDGELDRTRSCSFRTFPDDDRPLRLVFSSCARTGSNGQVFDAIRRLDPDVYVNIGDLHYGDVFVDDVDDYRQVLDVQLTRPAQAALYRSTPIAYVWDDHDYGPNDSNRNAPGRAAAITAYREYVPHYDLAGPESAIFQAFTIGTTRIVMTDARSARDPQRAPDTPSKTMLGDEQRRWLLSELERSAAEHDLVIWANPVPWVDPAEPGADSWAGYDAERRLIADHIASLGIDNLVMVSGDAHMVAIDDGTHTNHSSVDGRGFPLLHVAALDRPGSTKGGPYTQGPITGGGHFGVIEVEPTDGGLAVAMIAENWRGDELLRHDLVVPTGDRQRRDQG